MSGPAVDVIVMTAGAVADEASTRHALAVCSSCGEVGPFRAPAARYAAKAAVIGTSALLANQLRKDGHKGWAKVVRWSVFALYMGVAAHNLHVAKENR